ncbi:MAG TPA: ABC transporter permease [Vicinamibacterales bacterium]|nr:ABC transporter permease [Vicinamibacterales bacterium]
MPSLLRRLVYLLRERGAHADLDEELAFHRDMTARELEQGGAETVDAQRAARRALGNTSLAHDDLRDVWVPHALQGIVQDFRLAVRALAGTPRVSAAAILSLALGIGATTGIFSLIDGLLLRDLPVRDPGRLVMLTDGGAQRWDYWNFPVWRELHARTELFDGTLAWAGTRFDLANGGESDYVNGIWVSGSYFGVLGVSPLLGRTIDQADDAPAGGVNGPVAVISYAFWQRHFAGAPDIVGRGLTLDRVAFTIVGVAPRGFFGADVGHAFDVAVPLGDWSLTSHARGAGNSPSGPTVTIMARLRRDQGIAAATDRLRGIQPEIRQATLPAGWPPAFLARYLSDPMTLESGAAGVSVLRERFSRPLLAMLVVVALVLLVACANLANLSLARATARRRELGMRLALGASAWRLMRQLIVESFVLAGTGAAGGLVVASWMAGFLTRQLSTTMSAAGPNAMTGAVFLDTSVDARVLAFAAVVTIVTLLVFGTMPAWRASRVDPLDAVAAQGRTERRRAWRATDLFIAIQVAISLVLIASAGLLVRTFTALETRPLGFDRHGLLIATIDTQHASVSPEARQALYGQIVDAIRRMADVEDAALSFLPAVVNGAIVDQPIQAVSGVPPLPPRGANADANLISPGWFETMRIALVAGRDIGPGDGGDSPQVAIVNQAFARHFLGTANPIGHAVTLFLPGPPPPPVEIVGVVANSVYGGLRSEIRPTIYLPMAQRTDVWDRFLTRVDLTVRSRSGRVGSLEASVARTIQSVNPDLALTVHPLSDYVSDSLVQERLVALLSGGFAVLALALAAIGLYGVTAYAMTRRRTEIGIRLALGASAAHIVRLSISRLVTATLLGAAAGVVVSLWTSRLIASLLYGVQARDPANLAGAVGILVLAVTLAAWVPVSAALRTDPISTIRVN